jgi:hypothetical protein
MQINKTIKIRPDQSKWIQQQPRTFNLSEICRKAIDKEMKKCK